MYNIRHSSANVIGEHETFWLGCVSYGRLLIIFVVLLRSCSPRGHHIVFVYLVTVLDGEFLSSIAMRHSSFRREVVAYLPALHQSRGGCSWVCFQYCDPFRRVRSLAVFELADCSVTQLCPDVSVFFLGVDAGAAILSLQRRIGLYIFCCKERLHLVMKDYRPGRERLPLKESHLFCRGG